MSLIHLKNIDYVVKNSEHIKINEKNITRARKNLRKQNPYYWTKYCPAQFTDINKDDLAKVLFLFNSTSFSYWKENPWIVKYKNNNSDRGSWSNFLSIKRAIDENIPILDPYYQLNASNKDFAHLWRAKEEIPMLKTRGEFVRKNAQVLIKKYQGNINNLIEESGNDSVNLTKILLQDFETFKDSAEYKGKEVTFNKRAQLFSADIHYLIKPLTRIEELSGCADYKIPMTLSHYGVLEFSEELKEKIDKKQLIKSKEIIAEIRANELYAMELIAGKDYTAMKVNNFLWVTWQNLPKQERNYLRFRSTDC